MQKKETQAPLISMNRQAPSLQLPKGGGAIRGIDEPFSVNTLQGTAGLQVPIFASPGRGMAPSLALSYDSGAGNGPFGLGWSLGLPSISRRTDKKLPTYRDQGEQADRYLLAGAEELVPTLLQVGQGWQPDISERIETGETYTVQRFRPRIEGDFTRIERWTHRSTGEIHWRTRSPQNITAIFGRSAQARIADPSDTKKIFRWLLEEEFDDKGNVTQYQYIAEDLLGLSKAELAEHHRFAQPTQPQRYLKRVLYGNSVAYQRQGWLFEVIFDYGDHAEEAGGIAYASSQNWPARLDRFSTYRAGFEIRTLRLCQRALMFHHINALREVPTLVRSTNFSYEASAIATTLQGVSQTGYVWKETQRQYLSRSLPPMEFTYSQANIDDQIHVLPKESLFDLSEGAAHAAQWVDLEGEGLPGLLVEQDGALYYKHNLGEGQFAPLKKLETLPNLRPGQGRLMDLAGDGQLELVRLSAAEGGYYERERGGWKSYKPFSKQPNLRFDDPNLRMIDLDGDGRADLLLAEEQVWRWYPSLGEKGYASSLSLPMALNETEGPRLVFHESVQSVFLADMSGDGLTDLVRIRNGEVCYWPNLGYGRFGAKVTMADAPHFARPDLFHPQYLRLVDVDGSGTADLLYLQPDRIRLWLNQSGNAWSEATTLAASLPIDVLSAVSTADLKGQGTTCLIWSSPQPQQGGASIRYIDLMGGQKPYLMTSVKDNMGGETRMMYAASTKFYLADKQAGQPWATRLAFPVHVLEQVETFDHLTQTKLCSRYAYHHGYFDGEERAFRGFGRVEQWDTQTYSAYAGAGLFTQTPTVHEERFHLPPVRTVTWHHTGAAFEQEQLEEIYKKEYYAGDTQAYLLPDTAIPVGLSPQEQRDAYRALKGGVLRQEVYAEDDTPQQAHPFTVTESCAHVRLLQPTQDGFPAVFLVMPSESLQFHYERHPEDPRIHHEMTLEVDAYGQPVHTAQISYPRRNPPAGMPEQAVLSVVTTEHTLIHADQQVGWYRLGIPQASRSYDVTGLGVQQWTPATLLQQLQAASTLSYEQTPTHGLVQKRLLSRTRALYAKDDQTGPLAEGQVESLALPYESYEQIFTSGLLQEVFDSKVDATLLQAAGYQWFDGVWWAASGRAVLDAQHFYHPIQEIDALGHTMTLSYDSEHLFPTQIVDALGNTTSAQINYRVLQPWEVTDPNGNRTQVAFDALGMTVASAVMGKSNETLGDTLVGVEPDLDPTALAAFLSEPKLHSAALLGQATTRFVYDVTRYYLSGLPNVTAQIERETHVSELGQGETSRLFHSFVYADGSGRELMKKAQAEAGLAPKRDANGDLVFDGEGKLVMEQTSSRWVGSGAVIYDNKGNPLKKYEPFFSSTHDFEPEEELRHWGVTSLMVYDALGRAYRTELPDGTFSRVTFDVWRQVHEDPTDTVLESAWYVERGSPDPLGSEPTTPAARAAYLSAQHANTPTYIHLDAMGRSFLTEDDDGSGVLLPTRSTFDVEGNLRSVTDARGNVVMAYRYDMRGPNAEEQEKIEKGEGQQESHQVTTVSMDAGQRWVLRDVLDRPVHAFDSRGHHLSTTYDLLHRPTHQWLTDASNQTSLLSYTVYGESLGANASQDNHRGQIVQQYDSAGLQHVLKYDFKGQATESSRRFAVEYKKLPDWSSLGMITDLTQLAQASASLLESEVFLHRVSFHAQGKPRSEETPDGSVTRYTYNEASLLETVEVQVRGAVDGNSDPVWTQVVSNIDYDAKGQQQKLVRGNGVVTEYSYDPQSFRLTRLRSLRQNASVLQDLSYTYDASGNLTEQTNAAQSTVFYDNEVVTPTWRYVYDALSRLKEVRGREHAGQQGGTQLDATDLPQLSLASPSDPQAMRLYTRRYAYDGVGNLMEMKHLTQHGGWTRRYEYATNNNQLRSTSKASDDPQLPLPVRYEHDAHGNLTLMPHLPTMNWDALDRLHATSRQVVTNGTPETTYYVYDGSGQRMRKVTERQAGTGVTPTRKSERLYVGHWEVYRSFQSDGVTVEMERESLSVMEEQQRLALIDTKTVDAGNVVNSPLSIWRLPLGDHLGSASLEVTEDVAAGVLTYEEYHPFGTSSYRANNSAIDVSEKRYRYTGKERDEENGFGYHGARYYAPWLGRWTAADPAGLIDGVNLYAYVQNNPTKYIDLSGQNKEKPRTFVIGFGEDKENFFLAAKRYVEELIASKALRKGDRLVILSQRKLYNVKEVDGETKRDENKDRANKRDKWLRSLSRKYRVQSILLKENDALPVSHLKDLTIDAMAIFGHGRPRLPVPDEQMQAFQEGRLQSVIEPPGGGAWITKGTYLDSSQKLFSKLKFSRGALLGFFACSLSGYRNDFYIRSYYAGRLSSKLSNALIFSFQGAAWFGETEVHYGGKKRVRIDVQRTTSRGKFHLWKNGNFVDLSQGVSVGWLGKHIHKKGAISVFVTYIKSFFKNKNE